MKDNLQQRLEALEVQITRDHRRRQTHRPMTGEESHLIHDILRYVMKTEGVSFNRSEDAMPVHAVRFRLYLDIVDQGRVQIGPDNSIVNHMRRYVRHLFPMTKR